MFFILIIGLSGEENCKISEEKVKKTFTGGENSEEKVKNSEKKVSLAELTT